MNEFNEQLCRSIFTLAGIEVLRVWRLPNQYWRRPEADEKSPWFLVKTDAGLIQIGWRKRVISIDWSDTSIRQIVTSDEVTKNESLVHAWSTTKAVEYLSSLGRLLMNVEEVQS